MKTLTSDVENHGLTKSLLKKEVESRLRQADIPVLTADEAFNMPGKPYLYLNLTTHNTGIELYSYSIRIEFNQDVCMIRDPSIRSSATTWIANMVGIVGARNLRAVTEDVTQLTDKFIHDYLAANQDDLQERLSWPWGENLSAMIRWGEEKIMSDHSGTSTWLHKPATAR